MIDSGGVRRPGTVTVAGTTIALHDICAGSSATPLTCYGSTVSLNATAGGVVVDGSINNWAGQDSAGGGDVIISSAAAGDVTVSGGITNRTYRTADAGTKGGGNVEIDAAGGITIGGGIHSGVVHVDAVPGNLDLAAAGTIQLASLDVCLHNDIKFSAMATTVVGELLGLDTFIDGGGLTVGRFTAVTGDILYDPEIPANAYLDGKTYAILASTGGSYDLKPASAVSAATIILLR